MLHALWLPEINNSPGTALFRSRFWSGLLAWPAGANNFPSSASAGLYSRHLGQVATVLIPELEGRILEATRRAPTGGATDWCTR
jgi:hypothetical protein